MNDNLGKSINALNDIFADAHVHFRAHEGAFGPEPAIRIIYRGACLADPKADLTGEDRRHVASAFKKAGYPTGEYKQILDRQNGPALYMDVYTPPVDAHWMVGHVNPWILYLLRPDADFIAASARALAHELRLRYPNAQPKGRALVNTA